MPSRYHYPKHARDKAPAEGTGQIEFISDFVVRVLLRVNESHRDSGVCIDDCWPLYD